MDEELKSCLRWVSVKDRLPDKSGIYPAMSTVEGRTPPKDWIDALCLFDVDTKPGKIAWQHTTGFYDGAITHWLEWNTRAPAPEQEGDPL